MINSRKTALLKQVEGWNSSLPVRGVVRLNEEKGLSLSFLNLENKQNGSYYLVIGDGLFEITSLDGQEIESLKDVDGKEQILIVFYDGNDFSPVLHGSFSSQNISLSEALENAKKHFKKFYGEEKEAVVFQTKNYDDEAIADVNYYNFAKEPIEEKFSNERAVDNEEFDYSQNATAKEEKEEFLHANEPIPSSDSQFEQEKCQNFYLKIKSEIEELFKNYPKEEGLCKMVEGSNWVKIGGEKHYAVGVILENGSPAYICYGLPGNFKDGQITDGFSSFIPISPFALKGEGYWVSFQDAKTGKRVN